MHGTADAKAQGVAENTRKGSHGTNGHKWIKIRNRAPHTQQRRNDGPQGAAKNNRTSNDVNARDTALDNPKFAMNGTAVTRTQEKPKLTISRNRRRSRSNERS